MNKSLPLLLLLLAGFTACKKNDDTTTKPNTITIGDPSKSIVVETNAAKVDVNGDGNLDLELLGITTKTGPGPNTAPEFKLVCLHQGISIRADSVFIPMWLKQKDSVYTFNGNKFHQTKLFTNCMASTGGTSQATYRYAQALRTSASSTVSTVANYLNGEFLLNKLSFGFSEPPSLLGDTFYVKSYSTEYCHQLLQTGENYFCFKLSENGKDRFGWLILEGTEPLVISKIGTNK